ncbi:MAG: hypothetical protein PHW69_02065 [Elusimicrobiaceae bacterium]|nr:hypothetical protein [Elusimicrobiaceae bacterium]
MSKPGVCVTGALIFSLAAQFSYAAEIKNRDLDVFLTRAGAISVPVVSAAVGPDFTGLNTNLKSHGYSFTSRYQFVLSGEVIYMRKTGDRQWMPVPGQPAGSVEISADGSNLIALARDGAVSYLKVPKMKWKKGWGKPVSATLVVPANRSWAISNIDDEAGGFEDPAGNFKDLMIKVSTLYLLAPDGRHIKYADPWLPPDFGHRIAMPQRGRFVAEAMDASGSTLFIVNKAGQMYTRLADFDTTGADPMFAYSFTKYTPKVIALPGEDWRAQPEIPGRITARITIFTTGRGNAGRELRVEGVDALGRGGYYRKPIFGAGWEFVRTGAVVKGPFLGGPAEQGPEIDADYPVYFPGAIRPHLPENCVITFSPDNDIAYIRVPVGSGTVVLPLYIREGFYASRGNRPNLLGSVVVPDPVLQSSDPETAGFVKKYLRGKKVHDVRIIFDGKTIRLRPAPWRGIHENIVQTTPAGKMQSILVRDIPR